MKLLKKIYRVFTLALIFLLLFVMYKAIFGEKTILTFSPLVGKPAPEFTLITFDGNSISLSDYRGKAILVNFWASWCNPCKEEAPALEKFYKNLADENVEFLAVNVLDDRKSAEKYLTLFGGSFPNAYDTNNKIHLDYGVEGVPETFFISPDGIVTDKYRGPLSEKLIKEFIKRALTYNDEK
ncbi:MAG: TlpA family protein disulfide reductase [Thermodesulfobacteriota bacterium]